MFGAEDMLSFVYHLYTIEKRCHGLSMRPTMHGLKLCRDAGGMVQTTNGGMSWNCDLSISLNSL